MTRNPSVLQDTTLINIYLDLAAEFQNSNTDTSIYFCTKAVEISDRALSKSRSSEKLTTLIDLNKSLALREIGWNNFTLGNYDKAVQHYDMAFSIAERHEKSSDAVISLRAKKLKGTIYGSLAFVFSDQGNIGKALEYYFKAQHLYEECKDKRTQANNLGNIGIAYADLGDNVKAMDYYSRALKMNKEIGSKYGEAGNLSNIGVVFEDRGDLATALYYYFEALKINEETSNKFYQITNLQNIGSVFAAQGDSAIERGNLQYAQTHCFPKSQEYSFRALELNRDIGNVNLECSILGNIGLTYIKQKKYSLAEQYIRNSFDMAVAYHLVDYIKSAHQYYSDLYVNKGNYKLALEHHKLSVLYSDSILNEENTKLSIQKEMQFVFDKKAMADSIRVSEEKKVTGLQLEKEKTQRYALYAVLTLVFLFAFFIYNRFKITQRQKRLIELKEKETQAQKHIIEEKHKEITDSINYAERIQRSFLATKEVLNENLNEYFVFFKPKDVVSGDFYWAKKLSNGNFALATADSTGHGVPGAIMSLLNITSLEVAIKDGFMQPADILNVTRKIIIERLKEDGSVDGGKDGMDCSLVSFDFVNKKLIYAAANNSVWVVRPSKNSVPTTFISLTADRMPVGKHDRDQIAFSQHEFDLHSGDMVYTLTDGFPDQFGGPKGKKFKYKQLEELLVSIAHESLETQKQKLDEVFENWKGILEQVDDVCIIGIRV